MFNDTVRLLKNVRNNLPNGKKFGGKVKHELRVASYEFRGGSRAAAASKMERFVIIVNGFQPLTIITKRSILDVAAVLDPPLEFRYTSYEFESTIYEFKPTSYEFKSTS